MGGTPLTINDCELYMEVEHRTTERRYIITDIDKNKNEITVKTENDNGETIIKHDQPEMFHVDFHDGIIAPGL